MEENKKSKLGLGILIGVLIALVVVLSAFIIYDKVLTKSDNTGQSQNNNVETNSNNATNDNNSNSNSNTITSTDFDISQFDTTKEAINGTSGVGYQLVTNDTTASSVGLSIRLNEDKKSATITINWAKYFEIYGISITTGETREYNVTNFTKNIKEVYIGGFGQASGYETAFYVMTDGTVEYTPIKHALGNNGSSSATVLKSYGKIENVSDVVKVMAAAEYCPNINCMGGSYRILGIKADYTFYDLSSIIYQTDYYNF